MRILLAEDDNLLGDGLRAGLRQQGFLVDWVRDGATAQRELAGGTYDAMVLDLGLPGKDGTEVLADARRSGLKLPILVLTARDAVPDRIGHLDAGADDYIIKPVDLFELGARLRALVRRAHGQAEDAIEMHGLRLLPVSHEVLLNGEAVTLSAREFDLLHTLMLNAGRVMTRDQLERRLYSWGQEVESNAIEYHVHHLRRKLAPGLIETVRGVGYTMPRPQRPGRA
ncbi:MAG TPA: winged helix-turn-helix domain-containing protein [Casimicrobium huifangae]|nr:winged helix-turn-helix domain-containing protein [Casimicrobium huifangae]